MITWPESLPKPVIGFGVTNDAAVARTKMDSGRYRQRRRFTRAFRRMSATWKFSDMQYGYFQSIYHYLVDDGADWFQAYLPMGDGLARLYTVRFVADTYQVKQDEATLYWSVSVNLETEDETSPWSATEIDALVAADFDVDAFEGGVAGLHAYLHTILPTLMPG